MVQSIPRRIKMLIGIPVFFEMAFSVSMCLGSSHMVNFFLVRMRHRLHSRRAYGQSAHPILDNFQGRSLKLDVTGSRMKKWKDSATVESCLLTRHLLKRVQNKFAVVLFGFTQQTAKLV
jgi:hypothetical protein